MSEHEVEYCPWCGGDISQTIERQGHTAFQAKQCDDCETVFKVSVPHRETSIEWTNAH